MHHWFGWMNASDSDSAIERSECLHIHMAQKKTSKPYLLSSCRLQIKQRLSNHLERRATNRRRSQGSSLVYIDVHTAAPTHYISSVVRHLPSAIQAAGNLCVHLHQLIVAVIKHS